MPVTHARVVMSDACTTAGAKLAVKVSTKVEAVTRDCECEQDCAVNDTPALLTLDSPRDRDLRFQNALVL